MRILAKEVAMLHFNPQDPFPLYPEGTHTYKEEQEYSDQVDAWLGIQTEKVEKEIQQGRFSKEMVGAIEKHQQLWVGLPVQALLTPYPEVRRILELLKPKPGSRVVDLGSAYGRIGFVVGRHFPKVHFTGYEYIRQRVDESRRCLEKWGFSHLKIEHVDLSQSEFMPEDADFYFIYDFGARKAIEKILQDLRSIARAQPITVVGRGRATRDAIELGHPWLSSVYAPTHYEHYSLYRSGVDS